MDGGAWWAAVHGVAKSRTRLSDFPFTFRFHVLEKADVGNLISGSSAFSKTSFEYLKVHGSCIAEAWLENFEHYFTSV